jgi:glycosyltransferase involved in cell wall biosynthesis
MKFSIVIPAYNEEKYLGNCLRSCLKQATPDLLEIIVVNNASTDRTEQVARSFAQESPLVRVVYESWKGLTRARQRGFKEVRGDVLLSIDADTQIPDGWFQAMKQELEKPGVVCASGPYVFHDVPAWQRFFVMLYWGIPARFTYFFTGFMVVGGNFAAKMDALRRAGEFDTSIDFYGEDTDVGRRLHRIGKVKYAARCWIYSSGRRLAGDGLIRTPFVYALNYLSMAFLKKPFTKTYTDIR